LDAKENGYKVRNKKTHRHGGGIEEYPKKDRKTNRERGMKTQR
jgi:hypothetical protein